MSRLWGYLARYRARYFGGIVCLIGATSLTMVVPWLYRRAVDQITAGAGMAALLRTLGLIAAIMSRLVNDGSAVRMLLGPGILNFINTPVYYVYGLAIMLSIDVRLTLAAIAIYPVAFGLVKRTSALLMERSVRVQEGLADLSTRVQENLAGMHVVQAYAAEAAQIVAFERVNTRFQEQSLRLARVRGFIGPVMNVVGGAGALVVLWYGGRQVVAGRLSIGDLVAFIGYLHLLSWPTMALGWMLSVLQRGRAALARLDELFAVEPAITSPPGATAIAPLRGEVAFRGVAFRYPGQRDGTPVLAGVDLTIAAGQTVAIVGRTGAGKSALVELVPRLFDPEAGRVLLDGRDVRTLPLGWLRRAVGLVPRLFDPEAGRVLLDGRDVRTLPLGWLRRAVGLVPQEPFLFSRSLRENVAFALDGGLDGRAAGRVEWAVRMAGLAGDVGDMPAGLDTLVGERGVTLSGGQKQRATLARVLAAAPRVL